MEDRLPTRPLVSRAVRLMAHPRRDAADTALVTAVALRLAALDSDTDAARRLVASSDRVTAGMIGLLGESTPPREWSDTTDGLALLIAGRGLERRHLLSARSTLGSSDTLVELADRLRRTSEEAVEPDDLARALAAAVAAPAELFESLLVQQEGERPAGRRAARDKSGGSHQQGRPVPLRAVEDR